jgi:hypothetical protein
VLFFLDRGRTLFVLLMVVVVAAAVQELLNRRHQGHRIQRLPAVQLEAAFRVFQPLKHACKVAWIDRFTPVSSLDVRCEAS